MFLSTKPHRESEKKPHHIVRSRETVKRNSNYYKTGSRHTNKCFDFVAIFQNSQVSDERGGPCVECMWFFRCARTRCLSSRTFTVRRHRALGGLLVMMYIHDMERFDFILFGLSDHTIHMRALYVCILQSEQIIACTLWFKLPSMSNCHPIRANNGNIQTCAGACA